MATINKDFKVKNGLVVALGGSFGSAVTVGAPTENAHAATKQYVDSISLDPIVEISSTPPTVVNGLMYVDSVTNRLNIYINDEWVEYATLADTFELNQHIHDTAIDGTGIIVSIFQDGGFYDTQFTSTQDAGYYDFNEWAMSWNGGVAIDNFN